MPSILANLLRRMRKASHPKTSLTAIAEQLGVDQFYLSKVESGAIKKPTTDVLKKMAKLYDCGFPNAEEHLLNLYGGLKSGRVPAEDNDSLLSPLAVTGSVPLLPSPSLPVRRMLNDTIPEKVLKEDTEDVTMISPPSILSEVMRPNSWIHQRFSLARFEEMLKEEPRRLVLVPSISDPAGLSSVGRLENFGNLYLLIYTYEGTIATAMDERIDEFNARFDLLLTTAYPPDEAVKVTHTLLKLKLTGERKKK